MIKTGLFFGSFNPIHIGHLALAEYFRSHEGFQELWFVVSPQNPLKDPALLAPAHHRLEMVRLATLDNPSFIASDVEFQLPVPSYTVNTLSYLRTHYPDRVFTLLMGEDILPELHKWRNVEEIMSHHEIRVFPRGHHSVHDIDFPGARIGIALAPRIEISSTLVRGWIQEGRSVRYVVPDVIRKYITENQLYGVSF